MAVQIGIANNQYHLLDLFTTFVTTNAELVSLGQNWQVMKSETLPSTYPFNNGLTNPSFTGSFSAKYFRAPGLDGKASIYMNVMVFEALSAQLFSWFVAGATGFDPTKTFENQPGAQKLSQGSTYFAPSVYTLINSTINYWFIVNGRRAIIIAKVGGDFYMCHMGLILPYGKPSEYPYPLLVSGTGNNQTIGYNSTYLSNYYKPYSIDARAMLFIRDGFWAQVSNTISTNAQGHVAVTTWPYYEIMNMTEVNNIRGNLDGSFTLLPHILFSHQSGFVAQYGEVQGVFYIPGTGEADVTAEDTITIGSDTYLIIQNVNKASRNDFAAVLLK